MNTKNYIFLSLVAVYLLSFFLPSYHGVMAYHQRGIDSTLAVYFLFSFLDFSMDSMKEVLPQLLLIIFMISSNIIVILAIVFRYIVKLKNRLLIPFSIIAYLSSLFWLLHALYKHSFGSLKIGYYVWNLSILAILLFNLLYPHKKKANL